MGHLSDPALHKWTRGDRLFADQLTHNFGSLHALAEQAAMLAVEPDAAGAEALQRVANNEGRIAALERYNRSTARERGEQQFTPLATFGALLQQVNDLAAPLRRADTERTRELLHRRDAENDIRKRLASVESKPPPPAAPTMAEFGMLQNALAKARAEAAEAVAQVGLLRGEIAALRQETADAAYLRGTVTDGSHARLTARMDTFEASTAAEDVVALRTEVARLQRLVADTDRRDALNRFFTPRSMAAYMLKRLERVEAKLK